MADRKQFRLQILGADEDYPRFIRAYGRACGGDFAYLCEPGAFSYLVFVRKGEAWYWKQGSAASSRLALIDVPLAPTTPVLASEAVAKLQELGKIGRSVPPGPVTYRGQWSGALVCNGEGVAPTIVLTRKVAAYATIRIVSHGNHADPDGRQWVVTLERDSRWFADAKLDKEPASAETLRTAIRSAYGLLTGLVGEACSVRDTKRRAALDAEHAKSHPIKHPKDPKRDPIEAIKAPKPPKALKLSKAAKAEAAKASKAAKKPAAEVTPPPRVEKQPAGTIVEGKLPRRKKAKAEKAPKAEKPTATEPTGELTQAQKDASIMAALSSQMDKLLKDAA
ncbi:MAG: hypothetical protein EPN91_02015 [Salinibacterium sp.]|nr:MAG: hypothetical protein EPN91_02015 [Salinibacterium sp.]